MKTKTKKISLLAVSTIALAMPFAASAGAKSFISLNGTSTFFTGLSANTQARAPVLSNQDNLSSTFAIIKRTGTGAAAWAGSTNTYFKVAANTPSFSGTEAITFAPSAVMTAKLYDETTHRYVPLAYNGTSYNTSALAANNTYDFQAAYSGATSRSIFTTGISIASVPEPEQWAMMMVGLFLVAAKVTKTKKSATLLTPFNA